MMNRQRPKKYAHSSVAILAVTLGLTWTMQVALAWFSYSGFRDVSLPPLQRSKIVANSSPHVSADSQQVNRNSSPWKTSCGQKKLGMTRGLAQRVQKLTELQLGAVLLVTPLLILGWVCTFHATNVCRREAARYSDELLELNETLNRRVNEQSTELRTKTLATEDNELAFRQFEAQHLAILNNTTDAIMLLAPPDGEFISGNSATISMFGVRDESELVALRPWNLSPEFQPDGRRSEAKAKEMIQTAMKKGSSRFDWKHSRRNGDEFLATVCLTRIDMDGEVLLQATVRDISKERLAEKTVRTLHRAVEQSSSTIVITDSSGNIEYANPQFEVTTGYSVEEAVGKNPRFLKSGHQTHGFYKELWETISSGQVWRGEFLNQRKDGTTYWESAVISPVIYAKGTIVQYVAVKDDTTERKEIEKTVRLIEKRFRDVLHASNEAILLIDGETFVDVNDAAVRMLGYANRNDVMMTHPSELSPPKQPDGRDSGEKAREMIQTALAKGFHRFEWTHQKMDRTPFPVEVSLTSISYNGRTLIHCLWRDLTERNNTRQQQERSLRQLKEISRLQETLILPGRIEDKCREIANTAVKVLDLDFCRIWVARPADRCSDGCIHAQAPDGDTACGYRRECLHLISSVGRYTHINGNHQRMPLRSNKIGEIASGKDRKCVDNHLMTAPFVVDKAWAENQGLVAFAGYKLHNAKDQSLGVLAVFSKHPISDEDDAFLTHLAETASKAILDSNAEHQLREAKRRAEDATRAKSSFLANMSHEIRTPMTAILGYADLLVESVETPDAIDAAQTVKRNGEHLLQLINDILDISKIEAGKMKFERIRWSPRLVVTDVISLLNVRAQAKGLTLRDEYDGPQPETIITDPTRLQQVLTNLVGNAIKFTETGGIHIVTRLIDETGKDPKLQFSVTDTGIGIASEKIDQVFEAFTQADGSVTRHFGGTGLGLAISRQIVKKMGGELTATSRPGQGSTFTFSVAIGPLDGIHLVEYGTEDKPSREELDKPKVRDNVPLRCRILLADDLPDNRRLLGTILEEAGAEVTMVKNGREAVEHALASRVTQEQTNTNSAEAFDIILMDMQMPILDGYDATRHLRDQQYTGPIIAVTAHAMHGDRQKCIDAGCDDFVTKPVNRAVLLETVAKWLARRQQATTAAGINCCSLDPRAEVDSILAHQVVKWAENE